MSRKHSLFWSIIVVLVLADCTTKRYAVERLEPAHVPHEVLGDVVRFTLAYNPGAAFSMSLGAASRLVFAGLAISVLVVLFRMFLDAAVTDRWRIVGLALVAAGALGNLIDRIRWSRGVVDFIDIGIGDLRFWVFNVADMCVTIGAIVLGFSLLREERLRATEARAAGRAG